MCDRSNGLKCEVKCHQDVIENPPPIHSVITVKHQGVYSTGVLKFPTFWRERRDIEWNLQPKTTESGEISDSVWTKKENHKIFFGNIERELNIQNASDWYKVTKKEIYSRGGNRLLEKYYSNSVYKVTIIIQRKKEKKRSLIQKQNN